MNWIIWMTFAIILIGIIIGVYRGALRIAVSVVAFVLTMAITFFVTPYVADIVMEKTPVDDSIRDYVVSSMADTVNTFLDGEEVQGIPEEKVQKALKAAGISEDELKEHGVTVKDIAEGTVDRDVLQELGISSKLLIGESGNEAVVEELMENTEIPRDVQVKAIETAELPEVFKGLLKENNNNEIYSALGVDTFAQYVGTYLAKLMIHVATFLAIFLLVTIVIRAFVFALNIVNDIPVFGLVNRLAGGFLGIVCSLMVIWFFFIVVTLFYTTDIGRAMYDTIQNNDYMRIIYENNPLFNMSIKI